MTELNIGHAIVSRAIFVGLREAVREMKQAIETAVAAQHVQTPDLRKRTNDVQRRDDGDGYPLSRRPAR